MEPYLRKNALIVCPRCSKAVLKTARDVYEGEYIVENQITVVTQYGPNGPLKNQYRSPRNGDPIACLACGAQFGTITRISEFKGMFK